MQDGKETSLLLGNGAINFKIPIDPAIPISDSDITNIEEGAPLYKDKTLVQREGGDSLFVIYQGKRYLIENNSLTIKLYGLDKEPINRIGDILDKIPEGGGLPKYPEKTLIKSSDNTLYLIQDDKIYKIADKETLEAMGLSKTKEGEIIIMAKRVNYPQLTDPIMQLRINGKPIKEWQVSNSTSLQEYKVNVALIDGEIPLDIMLMNRAGSVFDPYLWIEEIKIDNKTYSPSQATFDRASPPLEGAYFNPNLYTDGKDVVGGTKAMQVPGALRFKINLDSAISLTNEEIANIPHEGVLPKQFNDGSLVQDNNGKSYFISQGEKRFISPEYLSFYHTSVNQTGNLSLIPEGEAFPKYPENSILTDGINKYLYTQGKKLKFETLDELTKNGFTPEEGNVPVPVTIQMKNKSIEYNVPVQLWIDGNMVKEWAPSSVGIAIYPPPPTTYNFDLPLSPGKHKIEVIFPQIKSITPIVDYIQIGDQIIQPEDRKGEYNKGGIYQFGTYRDKIEVFPSQEIITSPGALRFTDVEIIPSIRVSSEELNNIPSLKLPNKSASLDSSPSSQDPSFISPPWYEPYDISENNIETQASSDLLSLEGKFIKFDNYYFYIMNGRKRLVETLDAYLPKEKQAEIIEVKVEDLIKLKTGDPLPKIEFPDGSLIKYGGYTFIIFSGMKHLISNGAITLFGFDKSTIKDVDGDKFASIPTGEPISVKVVTNSSLGSFLLIGNERRYIPTDHTSSVILNTIGQVSAETIDSSSLLEYAPGDAVDKIEPPPPPPPQPQPKKKKWWQKVWSAVSGIVSTVVRGLPVIGQIYTFASAIAGKDFITGQKITGVDRWLSLLGPLSRGASQFKSLTNLATRIDKARDGLLPKFNSKVSKIGDWKIRIVDFSGV